MPTATRPGPSMAAFDRLMAPAHWLEQARGRRRVALLTLYLLLGGVGGGFGWRAVSLNGLPDVGDPFDVRAELAVDVPEAENAFVLYRQAGAKLKKLEGVDPRALPGFAGWAKAHPAVRRWAGANREAMDLFRRGSERPRALYFRPGVITFETRLEAVQGLREFARLAPMEAARLEEAGDLAGAWGWYRAVLRSSRHIGSHGTLIQGLVGASMLVAVGGRMTTWSADPRVDAPLLRRALRDVLDCAAMSPPASDMLKLEYLSIMKAIERPRSVPGSELVDGTLWYRHLAGVTRAEWYLRREPERSRRVIRLAFANWLAQCDRLPAKRPAIGKEAGDLFDADPSAPEAARALSPGAVREWLKTTRMASYYLPAFSAFQRAMDRDRRTLAGLKVTLAEQLYLREHGRPPKTLGALVGPDLPGLPEGFEAGDPPISTGATTPAP